MTAIDTVLATIIKLNDDAPAYERVPAGFRDIARATGLLDDSVRACLKTLVADGLVVAKAGNGVSTFATNYVQTVKALRGVLADLAADGIVLASVGS